MKKESNENSELKGRKEEKIKNIQSEIKSLEQKIKSLSSDIRNQERIVEVSGLAKDKLDLANKLRDFFKDYKDELKKKRRQEIEDKLNQFSQTLISSTTEIKMIKVYDDFSLHPFGKSDTPLGIHSLASGIRQLLATSLLWALKTVSGKTVPLVIDTPLGRIDREHQDNLLKYYYPCVGEQVIILPTDSELDKRKYNLLKPYICQEFQLRNPDGESSSYDEKSMY